jgi:hypothetical protein
MEREAQEKIQKDFASLQQKHQLEMEYLNKKNS